ncbi:MAG: hypothetical protein J6P94_06490, partial [Oscillospiraceae bacterium]|nr:hypothetical protein [Oscillospiraceae bacterium]
FYVSDGHILFVPAKRIWKEKQAKEGHRKPLFGISLTAAKRKLLCHIIKSETLVCAPRFPIGTLLRRGTCSAPRGFCLVLVGVSETITYPTASACYVANYKT